MAMQKCKECGEEISSSAKKCPKCGKDQRNFFMKHPAIYTILILVVVSAIASGSGEETTPTSKTTLSTDNTSASQTAQDISDTTNQTTTTEKTSYNVGEIFENNYMAVKYVSVEDDFKGYSRYADIKTDHKIIKLEFEFENISETDQLVSDYDFNCYADGYDCEKFYSVSDDYYGLSADLSAGKKTKGSIYFQVPKDATTITVEYEVDYWSSEKVEFIVK